MPRWPTARSRGWRWSPRATSPRAGRRAVGREDLIERQFEPPGSDAHAQVEAVFASRTRAEWEAFGAEHDCCLEPVLELEEALDSELVRTRGMVAELAQPGATEPVRGVGGGAAGGGRGADTGAVRAEAGWGAGEMGALRRGGGGGAGN